LVGEDTVIQETSPAPNPSTNSTQQRTEGLARYSNVSAGSRDGISPNNTITEDSDLQLDIGHSFVDEGLQQDTLGGQDDPTSNEAANSVDTSSADSPMARRRAPSLGEIRSTKLVQGKFDDLEQNGGMVHAFEVIKWCIESAKELEQLKAGKAAAKEALTTAENELQELEEHISEQLSAGKTLDEATRDLETDIKRLETLIDRLTAIQHEVAEEIAPGLANFDIQGSTDLASFDSTLTSANTAKTGKEHKLEELEQLAEQLNTKEEDRQNKAEEAERLDSEYVKLTNIMQDVKRFVELVPSDSAAMAKLTP
jgi:cob(I)alamin adenosyltransferase